MEEKMQNSNAITSKGHNIINQIKLYKIKYHGFIRAQSGKVIK
jgi:hypothetical protein